MFRLRAVRPTVPLAWVIGFGRPIALLAIAETAVRVAGLRGWPRRRPRWRPRRLRGRRGLHLRRYGIERSLRSAAEAGARSLAELRSEPLLIDDKRKNLGDIQARIRTGAERLWIADLAAAADQIVAAALQRL